MTRYLAKQEIVRLNEATVRVHGGNFMPLYNFLHEENLDYLIEAVQADLFGEPMYPTIADKAAVYCFSIINNHIFTDGNKRTGLGAALNFLTLNNLDLAPSIDDSLLTSFIIKVASGESSLDECRTWFAAHTVPL